jgi:TRAP-type C4-dicarboxylate transport system permease small subunit
MGNWVTAKPNEIEESCMATKVLHLIKCFYKYFPTLGCFLANLAVCAMTLIVTVTAVTRYVFNWTPGWADSVCAFLVAFAVFMGAGYSLMKGEHVRITFLFKKLPPGIQLAVELVCGLLALLYVGYLAYSTTELAMMSSRLNSRTPDGLLLAPLQVWLPIGLLMLMVALIGFTVITARKLWDRSPEKQSTGS